MFSLNASYKKRAQLMDIGRLRGSATFSLIRCDKDPKIQRAPSNFDVTGSCGRAGVGTVVARTLWLTCRSRADLQRAWKDLAAVGKGQDVAGCIVRAVFRSKSLDDHGLADFQSVFGESFSDGHARG